MKRLTLTAILLALGFIAGPGPAILVGQTDESITDSSATVTRAESQTATPEEVDEIESDRAEGATDVAEDWGATETLTTRSEDTESERRVDEPRRRVDPMVLVGMGGRVDADEETPEVVMVLGSGIIEGRVRHDMVAVFSREVEILGEVGGDLVAPFSQIRIDGEVGGELVAPFSQVELGPKAHIRGDMVLVGGALVADAAARVDGERVELTWEQLRENVPGFAAVEKLFLGAKDWLVQGVLLGRPLPHTWGWWWWVAIAMAALYFFLTLVAPRPVALGAEQLKEQPVACFFIGILGYVLANVLLLILAATGVGVFAMPFIFLGLLIIQFVGKASLYQMVGGRLGSLWGGEAFRQPLPAVLAGLVVFTVVYMIPLLGLLAWLIAAPLAFGGALMAMFQGVRAQESPPPPSSRPVPELVGLGQLPVQPSAAPTEAVRAPGLPPVIGESPAAPALGMAEMASLPRAGFWVRLAATALDLLVVIMPLAIVDLAEYFLVPWIAYHVVLWAWRGTTVGGVVCRLKVVRSDGQPLNVAVALVRALASVLSALALFLGFFWAGWTRERLAWHDMIAGTAIVKVPQGTPLI